MRLPQSSRLPNQQEHLGQLMPFVPRTICCQSLPQAAGFAHRDDQYHSWSLGFRGEAEEQQELTPQAAMESPRSAPQEGLVAAEAA